MLLVQIIVLNGVFSEILGAFINLFSLSGNTWEELFEEWLVFFVVISLLFLRVDILMLSYDFVEIVLAGARRPFAAELLVKETFSVVVKWCDAVQSAKILVEASLPLVELWDFLF